MASWDRRDGEPAKAYAHFTVYRDLGPERSLAKVGQLLGISTARCEQLSEQYAWVARCDQWDAHLQKIHDRGFLKAAEKRGKQRGQAFTLLLGRALQALEHITEEQLQDMSLDQIAKVMKIAAEGMRLEDGLATKKVQLELQDARSVISSLPTPVRAGLLRALAEHARSTGSGAAAGGVPLGLDEPE